MAQTTTQTKEINGTSYRVGMLDPLTANDILVDLGKALAPTLASLGVEVLSAENSEEVIKKLLDGGFDAGDGFEDAILKTIDRIEKATLREIISHLATVTEIKNGDKWPQLETVFTVHFRGKIGEMYKWMAFALKVQFGNF